MKKLIIALAAVLVTVASYGQGQVNFQNRVGTGGSILNAPVKIAGTENGPGPDWTAQLFLVGPNNSLTPLTPPSTFAKAGTGSAAISSQFWAQKTVDVPGHFAGENLNFVVQSWLTSLGSYDAAVKANQGGFGASDPFSAVIGGASSDPSAPPATPANLVNLKAFTVAPQVPEPSIIALGVLGASALLLRRRK
jgi:hypothetical protein